MREGVLITGAAGFIGSNLANYYARRGKKVFGVDNFVEACGTELHPDVKMFCADIRNTRMLTKIIRDCAPEVISHHAALIDPRASFNDPVEYVDVNVTGTVSVAHAAYQASVHAMVLASSCAVYGNPDSGMMWEESPLAPVSPYGASKVGAEACLKMLTTQKYGPHVAILRYPNIYGGEQRGTRETGVIAQFVHKLLFCPYADLAIYGTGEQTYQYLHVDDLITAHDLAVELMLKRRHGNMLESDLLIANIVGEPATVNQIFDLCCGATGAKRSPTYRPSRIGEQWSITMPGEVAKSVLGWKPTIGIREGIQRVVEFKQANPKDA